MATHSDVLAATKVARFFPGSKILPDLHLKSQGVGFCEGCGHCTVNVDSKGIPWHEGCLYRKLGL